MGRGTGPTDMTRSRMLGSATRAAADQAAGGDRACAALDVVAEPVQELLRAFLSERTAQLVEIDPALERVGDEVAALVAAGGKGLRPAFVYWGHRAAGGAHEPAVLAPAAAVELLHTFALIHDDVMDRSPQRRGRPAVHEALADVHGEEGLVGESHWFGIGGAILAGDLAFVWADELLDGADLSGAEIERARRVFTRLRIEVMAGQYLDLRLAGLSTAVEDDALRVALLKSGRYTVTRPLQLGAAIAGEGGELDGLLSAFGDAVGIGFQLRDDILGLFGDPVTMGKGATTDLREGKRTILILRALEQARASDRAVLEGMLGDPHVSDAEAEQARTIITASGALEAVEQMIIEQHERSLEALEPLRGPARQALEDLASLALYRTI
jgi:geranylgeranyl diphosphate synthase, type I